MWPPPKTKQKKTEVEQDRVCVTKQGGHGRIQNWSFLGGQGFEGEVEGPSLWVSEGGRYRVKQEIWLPWGKLSHESQWAREGSPPQLYLFFVYRGGASQP